MSIDDLRNFGEEQRKANPKAVTYVNAEWLTDYGEETYGEFFKSMDEVRDLLVNEHLDADRIRFVFGFDN